MNYHCMGSRTEMQHSAMGNRSRRYIFAVGGGMLGTAARNNRMARLLPAIAGSRRRSDAHSLP